MLLSVELLTIREYVGTIRIHIMYYMKIILNKNLPENLPFRLSRLACSWLPRKRGSNLLQGRRKM